MVAVDIKAIACEIKVKAHILAFFKAFSHISRSSSADGVCPLVVEIQLAIVGHMMTTEPSSSHGISADSVESSSKGLVQTLSLDFLL